MKKRIFINWFSRGLLLSAMLVAQVLHGQQHATSGAAPTSGSNEAGKNKFSTAMDYHTGKVSVSTPLITAASDNISVPISLSYTATTGVPVGMIASMVGLGWSLDYGGSITREVRGLPDDLWRRSLPRCRAPGVDPHDCIHFMNVYNIGYLYQNSRPEVSGRRMTTEGLKGVPNQHGQVPYLPEAVEAELSGKEYDLEPDVYHYSVGGVSGSFVFDSNGDPVDLANNNVKIEYRLSRKSILDDEELKSYIRHFDNRFSNEDYIGFIEQFSITLASGVKYDFA